VRVFVMSRDVLSDEMHKACSVYGQWLVDASTVSDDDKVPYDAHTRNCFVGRFLEPPVKSSSIVFGRGYLSRSRCK